MLDIPLLIDPAVELYDVNEISLQAFKRGLYAGYDVWCRNASIGNFRSEHNSVAPTTQRLADDDAVPGGLLYPFVTLGIVIHR